MGNFIMALILFAGFWPAGYECYEHAFKREDWGWVTKRIAVIYAIFVWLCARTSINPPWKTAAYAAIPMIAFALGAFMAIRDADKKP